MRKRHCCDSTLLATGRDSIRRHCRGSDCLSRPLKAGRWHILADLEEMETLPRASQKRKSYRQCCYCSLGTATTVWASFQIVIALFQLLGGYSSGPVFVAGAVVSMLTASLQLTAAGQQNAFAAYTAFYLQTITLLLWGIQFVFITAFFVRSCVGGKAWSSRVSLGKYISGYDDKYKPQYEHISVSVFSFFLSLLLFYVAIFISSFFLLRMLWSFYRVLQAGGTTFEYKTAEDIETALLEAQLPSMENYHATDEPSPRPT